MKTAQEYIDALHEAVEVRVEGFKAVLAEYSERQPTEVDEYLTELGLEGADDKVRNFVTNAIHTTLVLAVLADMVGGVSPLVVMVTGMSPDDIGEQIVANSTQGETNLDQFAELLVEVHAAVSGSDLPVDEDGNTDVHAYIYARETFPGPADLAHEIVEAFQSLTTTQAA